MLILSLVLYKNDSCLWNSTGGMNSCLLKILPHSVLIMAVANTITHAGLEAKVITQNNFAFVCGKETLQSKVFCSKTDPI